MTRIRHFEIKLIDGTTAPVNATFYGPFAVHRQINSPRWQVTHIPTCHSTLNRRGTDTRQHALAFTKWLRSLPINWKQDDALALQNEANAYFTAHGIKLTHILEEIENPCSTAKPCPSSR
jgi:hypothetical protein